MRNGKNRRWLFLLVPPVIVLVVFLFGEVVMHLWNWLLPTLFGLHAITFWQALGLLVLCRILFGGFGGHGKHRGEWRRRSRERWERMTPEERAQFRHKICHCFGSEDQPSETREPA